MELPRGVIPRPDVYRPSAGFAACVDGLLEGGPGVIGFDSRSAVVFHREDRLSAQQAGEGCKQERAARWHSFESVSPAAAARHPSAVVRLFLRVLFQDGKSGVEDVIVHAGIDRAGKSVGDMEKLVARADGAPPAPS